MNPNVTESSGNVFADLGLDQPDVHRAKARLAIEIGRLIKDRGLTQKKAAEILGVDQPKISALVRGRLTGFTLERLLRFLADLNCDVEITVRPARQAGRGHIAVAA